MCLVHGGAEVADDFSREKLLRASGDFSRMGQNHELGVELCRLGERMDGGSAGQGLAVVVVALFPRELVRIFWWLDRRHGELGVWWCVGFTRGDGGETLCLVIFSRSDPTVGRLGTNGSLGRLCGDAMVTR